MKVSLILKGPVDQFGRQRVVVRSSDGQTRTFKKTDVKLTPEQYKRFSHHTHLPKERDLYARFLACLETPVVSPFPDADFKTYAYQCLREWNKTKKGSTLFQMQGEVDRFESFAGPQKMGRVTVQLLNDYKTHILKDRGNNTAWKTFKALKTFFNKAVKERVIELSPFSQFENIKYKTPHKKFLTKEQTQALEDYTKEDIPERLRFIGTWFLIGCYTALRFSDMQQFGKHLIKGGRLILYTTKTNEPVSLPMNDKLKELFTAVHYKPVDITNQKMNEFLKVIANAADLPPLNVHMSRHTFAVRCADAGISPEVCAKLMGITNLRTVAVYYKLNAKRIDGEFSRLFA
ncbi:MAG TPA: site-specific integrase [Flavisolibacter sp.]|nr:site-specific integrase [Flavisolibacter sp.]